MQNYAAVQCFTNGTIEAAAAGESKVIGQDPCCRKNVKTLENVHFLFYILHVIGKDPCCSKNVKTLEKLHFTFYILLDKIHVAARIHLKRSNNNNNKNNNNNNNSCR